MKKAIILLAVCIAACQSINKEDSIVKMNLENCINNAQVFDLAKYSGDIQYVALETKKECLLGEIFKIIKTDDFYLASGSERNLYLFGKDGKFIRQIGKQGKGPGEYIYLADFAFNKKENLIYLNSAGQIMKYTIEGKLVETVKLPNSMLQVLSIIDDSKLAYIYPFSPYSDDKDSVKLVSVYDSKLQELKTINTKFIPTKGGALFNWIYTKNSNTYYKEEFGDIIYKIDKDLNVIPEIALGLGNKAFTPELFDFSKTAEWGKYYRVHGMYEFDKYTMINLQKGLMGNNIQTVIYDKGTKTAIAPKSVKGERGIWVSGVEWIPICDSGETLVMYSSALTVKESKSEKLKSIASGLIESSNPVLMVAKMN